MGKEREVEHRRKGMEKMEFGKWKVEEKEVETGKKRMKTVEKLGENRWEFGGKW